MSNAHLRKTLTDMLPKGPRADHIIQTIHDIGNVGDMLAARADLLNRDVTLSPIGRTAQLAATIRADVGRAYAHASRPVRRGLAGIKAQRDALTVPQGEGKDMVGEMRRAEARAFLKALPPQARLAKAREFAASPALAAAIFDMPPEFSGLDDTSLKMPQTNSFAELRDDVLKTIHGNKIAELDAQESDLRLAEQMATFVRNDIFKSSGLAKDAFNAFMQPLEAEADK